MVRHSLKTFGHSYGKAEPFRTSGGKAAVFAIHNSKLVISLILNAKKAAVFAIHNSKTDNHSIRIVNFVIKTVNLDDEITNLSIKITNLVVRIASHDDVIASHDDRIANHVNEIASHVVKIESYDDKIGSLSDKIAVRNAESVRFHAVFASRVCEIVSYEAENAKSRSKITTCSFIFCNNVGLEEAHRLFIVGNEHIFVVAVVVKHHFVIFSAETALFITAERRVSGIIVIAIDPDASGFDGARDLVKLVRVACPDSRAETVKRVVGDFDRFGFVFESRDRSHGTEDFFLKHAHFVVTFEQGRLNVETFFDTRVRLRFAARQNFRAFVLADLNVV